MRPVHGYELFVQKSGLCPTNITHPRLRKRQWPSVTKAGNAWGGPKRSQLGLIYCTVFAKSAKLPTPPWPPAMRSI